MTIRITNPSLPAIELYLTQFRSRARAGILRNHE